MRFFSRSGDYRGRWTAGRRNTSPSISGPADTFPNSPSISPDRAGAEDDLWGEKEPRNVTPVDGASISGSVVSRDGSKYTCRDDSVGPTSRRAMPACYAEGFGAALAAAGKGTLNAPPHCVPIPLRGSAAESARRRGSPASSATGSACSNGSPPTAEDNDTRSRKNRRRRRHSGGNISMSPAWDEATEWAAQQISGIERTGSGRGQTTTEKRTPVHTRNRSMLDKPSRVGIPMLSVLTRTPPRTTCRGSSSGALSRKASRSVERDSSASGNLSKNATPARSSRKSTAAPPGDAAGNIVFPANSGSPAMGAKTPAAPPPPAPAEVERSAPPYVGPPPPINTRPAENATLNTGRAMGPVATVCTPPMMRPPPPATTAPSPPAPPPPSQKAPSPPAGVNTGGGPRGGGGGEGLRAPEPPPVQAPLPPTSVAGEPSESAPFKWSGGGDGLVGNSGGGGVAGGGGGQGLGLGPALGLGLGIGLGQVQGQGQGAPEGFRPPRLRMFSNPGTLSNPGGCRAAVARYNDKRQSYKFSDKGALTLKNYGLRIGRGGVREYSEEVLSPTGYNGNGTVGPFFSSSGGGDVWVEVPPDAMSANVVRLEELGHGATGSVYKAVHARTLQLLAVKEVPVHDKSRRDQIGAELRLLKHCREDADARAGERKDQDGEADGSQAASGGSPSSLVAFYDAFTLTRSGYVSIVMEYCSGGSLQDLINRQGPLKEASIASIGFDMAQGLLYMHSLNMLHRDIKPANILLDREGRVKLADFGLVRSLDEADSASQSGTSAGADGPGGYAAPMLSRRERAHSFVGTAIYMSPERLQGEPYGPAADVWSLGLTLLTLAIGAYPLEIPKNNLYWNLVKLVCPQISSFHSGLASSTSGSAEYADNSSTAEGAGGGGYDSAGNRPGSEAFRSVPRSSRRDPMSVFLPPKRAVELHLSGDFLSFLRGCLRYETDERMTAQDMLKHPFLQVPPSERGISLAAAGGAVAAAASRDGDHISLAGPGPKKANTSYIPNSVQHDGICKVPPKRDEYRERVMSLTAILSAVAKFHLMNAKGGRRRSRSHLYLSGITHDNLPYSAQPPGYSSTAGYASANGIGSCSPEPAIMGERSTSSPPGRADCSASFYGEYQNSGSGIGSWSLRSVMEEPLLDSHAFERLGKHIGVPPVVVEAVWRDEWTKQVEAESRAEADALAKERENRDSFRGQFLPSGETGGSSHLEDEAPMVALDRLLTSSPPLGFLDMKLDE